MPDVRFTALSAALKDYSRFTIHHLRKLLFMKTLNSTYWREGLSTRAPGIGEKAFGINNF